MIPILKTPSQIYFDQHQENIYPSSDEVLQEIQSQSNIDTKPPFQFPLKEYTQEILNITKYNSEKKIPTFSTALNLNTPSILTPETFYTNKTIYENPSTSSQSSSTANNSYFMLQSIKSTTQNAMNFTLNDPKISPLTFLEKVEKLKGKKKLNASTVSAPVSYQSFRSKQQVTKTPMKKIKFFSGTGFPKHSDRIIFPFSSLPSQSSTSSPTFSSGSNNFDNSVSAEPFYPDGIQITVR